MSRKASRLYGRMQHGIAEKKARVDVLHKRRKEIERSKAKGSDGKTVLKKKVERLKQERKEVADTYADTGGSMKKKKNRKST